MPTPEESNAAMRIIEKLQHEYTDGRVGLPPGAEWVESAFAYIEHGGVYDDEAQVTQLLTGYGILSEMPPPPPPPPTFDEALDLPDWWEGFKAFTATEFSSENPDFVDAVRNQSMDAPSIYNTFVRAGSDRQVNISGGQLATIDAAFADDADAAPDFDIFGGAYNEILGLMRKDSWRRYLASLG